MDISDAMDKLSTVESELNELNIPYDDHIGMEFYDLKGNKNEALLDDCSFPSRQKAINKEFKYSFKKPVYVASISVSTEGFGLLSKMSFSYLTVRGDKEVFKKQSSKNHVFVIKVNDLIKEFSFTPDKQFLGHPELVSVSAVGLSEDDFLDTIEKISDVNNLAEKIDSIVGDARSELRKIEVELGYSSEKLNEYRRDKEAIEKEIVGLNGVIADLGRDIEELDSQKMEASGRLELMKEKIEAGDRKVEDLDSSIASRREFREGLDREIFASEMKLKELESDINLFPTEISAFVNQGGHSIKRYSLLAAIPLVLLAVVTFFFYSGAVNLTHLYEEGGKPDFMEVFALLLTRIPYVVVSMLLIHAAFSLTKLFVSEVIRINNQRLSLSKISIIATDVSNASEADLKLDDETRYRLRTNLKMQLLREHLKTLMPATFDTDVFKLKAKNDETIISDVDANESEPSESYRA